MEIPNILAEIESAISPAIDVVKNLFTDKTYGQVTQDDFVNELKRKYPVYRNTPNDKLARMAATSDPIKYGFLKDFKSDANLPASLVPPTLRDQKFYKIHPDIAAQDQKTALQTIEQIKIKAPKFKDADPMKLAAEVEKTWPDRFKGLSVRVGAVQPESLAEKAVSVLKQGTPDKVIKSVVSPIKKAQSDVFTALPEEAKQADYYLRKVPSAAENMLLKQVFKIPDEYIGSPLEKDALAAGIIEIGGIYEGLTGQKLELSDESYRALEQRKISPELANFAGQTIGAISMLSIIGKTLKTGEIGATIAKKFSRPVLQRFVAPTVAGAIDFGSMDTLHEVVEQVRTGKSDLINLGKAALGGAAMGAGFGATVTGLPEANISFLPRGTYRVAGATVYGIGSAKISGASDSEAAINGAVMGLIAAGHSPDVTKSQRRGAVIGARETVASAAKSEARAKGYAEPEVQQIKETLVNQFDNIVAKAGGVEGIKTKDADKVAMTIREKLKTSIAENAPEVKQIETKVEAQKAPEAPIVALEKNPTELKKVRHYTKEENIPAILEQGFDTSKPPVHGTGGMEAGEKTGKLGKDVLYFTTDSGRWNTAEIYVGEDKGDISRPAYDYETQKFIEQKNAFKQIALKPIEAEIKSEAKILVIDSATKYLEFQKQHFGDAFIKERMDDVINKAKELGYDIVNFKHDPTKWELGGKLDRYGNKDWYAMATGNSGKDDYFVLNRDILNLPQSVSVKENLPESIAKKQNQGYNPSDYTEERQLIAKVIDERYPALKMGEADKMMSHDDYMAQRRNIIKIINERYPNLKLSEDIPPVSGEPNIEPSKKTDEVLNPRKFPIVQVPVSSIGSRPQDLQFKLDVNAEGEQREIQGDWNELAAGNLLLWQDKSGKLWVANGHHRLAAAKRKGIDNLNAQIIKESEGYSIDQARAIAAEANILEGKGTIYDQAEYFRLQPKQYTKDVARRRGIAGQGFTIGSASTDNTYAAFRNRKISPAHAEAITEAAPNNEPLQNAGVKYSLRNPKADPQEVKNYIHALGLEEKPADQGDMFGFNDSAIRDAEKKSRIASSIQQDLRDKINSVRGAAKRPETARALGVDVKDPEGIATKIKELQGLSERWDKWYSDPELVDIVKKTAGEASGQSQSESNASKSSKLVGEFENLGQLEFGKKPGEQYQYNFLNQKYELSTKAPKGDLPLFSGIPDSIPAPKVEKTPIEQFEMFSEKQNKTSSRELASTGSSTIGKFEQVKSDQTQDEGFKIADEVRAAVEEYFTTIGERYTSGNQGIYYRKSGNMRIKALNAIDVAAHESTHALNREFGITEEITQVDHYTDAGIPVYPKETLWLRQALTAIYLEYYPGAKKFHKLKKRVEEGLATFVEHFVTNPSAIREKYPELVKEFLTTDGKYYSAAYVKLIGKMHGIIARYQALNPLYKVGAVVTNKRRQDEIKDTFLNFKDNLITEFVDNVHPIVKLAQQAGVERTSKDPSLWVRQYNSVNAIIASNMTEGKGLLTFNGEEFKKTADKNPIDLVNELQNAKALDEFAYWLVSRRAHFDYQRLDAMEQSAIRAAQELKADNEAKKNGEVMGGMTETERKEAIKKIKDYTEFKKVLASDGFDRAVVTQAYEQNSEEFSKYADIYDKINNSGLKMMEYQGLITPTQYVEYTSREGYASFKRDVYDELLGAGDESVPQMRVGKTKVSSTIGRKGSQLSIINPLYSLVKDHAEIMRKVMKQQIYNKMAGIIDAFPEMFQKIKLIRKIDPKTGMITYPQDKDQNIIMARDAKGQRVPILTSREIKSSIDDLLSYKNLHIFESLVRSSSRMFTKGTTGAYPLFAVSNYIVDQVTAAANTRTKFIPIYDSLANVGAALFQQGTKEAIFFKEYIDIGGERQTLVKWQDMSPDELFNAIAREKNGLERAADYLNQGMDIVSLPGKWSEIVTRGAEYVKSRLAGNPQIVAFEDAGRVTAPFHHVGRWGGGTVGQTVIKAIPFFNPGIQVLAQAARTLGGKETRNRALFVHLAVLASAVGSMAYLLENGSDQQKQLLASLEPKELASYLWIPHPTNKEKLIKLRMPNEMMAITTAINMALIGNKTKMKYSPAEYADAMTAFLPDQLDPAKPTRMFYAWLPQVIKPIIEATTNTRLWPNLRPLETQEMKSREPRYRFRDNTSMFAKWLGDKLNLSPIKIDYLIEGYIGRVSRFGVGKPISNPVVRDMYFTAGRQIQDYYDVREAAMQKMKAYKEDSRKFTNEEINALTKQLGQIKVVEKRLKVYREIEKAVKAGKREEAKSEIYKMRGDILDDIAALNP